MQHSKTSRRTCLLAFALLIGVIGGCKPDAQPAPNTPANANVGGSVKLTIDFDNRQPTKQLEIPLSAGMTAFDALLAAKTQGVDSLTSGTGEKAFVQKIGDLENEDPSETAKYWIFYVNGKQGTRSSGVYTLQPNDAIIWRFEKRD